MAVIKAKKKGETIAATPTQEEEEPADLLAALKASVEAAKKGRSVRAKRPPARKRTTSRKKKASKR
jgi:non-homologous end joining protein Ku